MFSILNSRQKLHFSAAHMTIFQDGSKEALHGHNYQVTYELFQSESNFKLFLDFSIPKEIAQRACEELDEKILIAKNNPFQKVLEKDAEIEIQIDKKRYVFPKDEVVVMDTDNIISENIATFVFSKIRDGLQSKLSAKKEILATLKKLKVTVWESVGQGASYEGDL